MFSALNSCMCSFALETEKSDSLDLAALSLPIMDKDWRQWGARLWSWSKSPVGKTWLQWTLLQALNLLKVHETFLYSPVLYCCLMIIKSLVTASHLVVTLPRTKAFLQDIQSAWDPTAWKFWGLQTWFGEAAPSNLNILVKCVFS